MSAVSHLFLGVFQLELAPDGQERIARHPAAPALIPDPSSGRMLKVATVDDGARAICPSCAALGHGGFISFESDLRLAYACPSCRQLIWLAGA
jgi:hypothetical protein